MTLDDCPPQEYTKEEWCSLTVEQQSDYLISGELKVYFINGQLYNTRMATLTTTYRNVCSWMESLDDKDRDKIYCVIHSLSHIDISNVDSMEISCTCELSNATVTLTGKMTKNKLEISKHILSKLK